MCRSVVYYDSNAHAAESYLGILVQFLEIGNCIIAYNNINVHCINLDILLPEVIFGNY